MRIGVGVSTAPDVRRAAAEAAAHAREELAGGTPALAVLLGSRSHTDQAVDLLAAVQRRSAAQLGDHGTVRAGDNVRFPDRPAALRHHGNAVRAGQAHADQPGGEHVAVTKQPGVAPPTPTAHHPADDGRSRQVGVEVLDEQIRRERVRVRQQQVQVVRGPVEAVTGDQSARAGANEVQVECLRGWAGRQPHRHRGLVLQLVATGDDALGHATDQRGRLDRRLHRLREIVLGMAPDEQELVSRGLQIGIVVDEHLAVPGQGDFLIRGLLGADPTTGAIGIGEVVEVGATVQFQVRDAAAADKDLRLAVERAAAELPGPPVGGLLFTCNGRGRRMFGVTDHDASTIEDLLGGIPLAGFFAAGEIGPVAGHNALHGFTASMALFVD